MSETTTQFIVLVVDDDDACRLSTRIPISHMPGVLALDASGGKEALEICDISRVDLVLLDLMMPDMDGFEVAVQLRKRSIPFIALTAMNDDATIKRLVELGAFTYLFKPIEHRQLIAIVHAGLHYLRHVSALERAVRSNRKIGGMIDAISLHLGMDPIETGDVLRQYARDNNIKLEAMADNVEWIIRLMSSLRKMSTRKFLAEK